MSKLSNSKALEKKLTADQLERVRSDFKRYDANGDGTLTVAEFRKAMAQYLSEADFNALLKEVNPGGNSTISWKEFLNDYYNDLNAEN